MSDAIKHECGIAHIRLLKPLDFYKKKYGTAFYGINKMYLIMEKQHNRGQDGAGFASIKLDMQPGERYISRVRSVAQQPIQDIFSQINSRINDVLEAHPEVTDDTEAQKKNSSLSRGSSIGTRPIRNVWKKQRRKCSSFFETE